MGLISFISGVIAPAFIIVSPLTSYADQTYAIHRSKSSAGFSLDIPLIMLVASLLRVFYYPGAKFDTSLLIQSFIMIGIQTVLLKVALDHRPGPSSKGGEMATPFASEVGQRPYNFWQWRSPKPYWQFLLYLFLTLFVLEIALGSFPGVYATYSSTIGYLGLAIEATLPIPQILSNHRTQSTKGFRLSVLISWIAGDLMKMLWFYTSLPGAVPLAFKLCGVFQMCCDFFLGFQALIYGDGDKKSSVLKDHMSLSDNLHNPYRAEVGRRTSPSLGEKDPRRFA